jgi:hypothetical protein
MALEFSKGENSKPLIISEGQSLERASICQPWAQNATVFGVILQNATWLFAAFCKTSQFLGLVGKTPYGFYR